MSNKLNIIILTPLSFAWLFARKKKRPELSVQSLEASFHGLEVFDRRLHVLTMKRLAETAQASPREGLHVEAIQDALKTPEKIQGTLSMLLQPRKPMLALTLLFSRLFGRLQLECIKLNFRRSFSVHQSRSSSSPLLNEDAGGFSKPKQGEV